MNSNLNFKNQIVYDQNSCRITIDGLPDFSIGQESEKIGIISQWKLQLTGFPDLEGKKDHLINLMSVIYSYISIYNFEETAVSGDLDGPVHISSFENKHKLILVSSRENTNPLEIIIDDAELIDIVNCFDQLKSDNRIAIDWINIIKVKRISTGINYSRYFKLSGIIPSLLGFSSLIITSFILTLTYDYQNKIDQKEPNDQSQLNIKDNIDN